MITVAVDAMGGDRGVAATVEGAALLSREETDIHVLLVGDVPLMSAVLETLPYDPAHLALVAAEDWVGMDEKPREALERKPRCSVLEAARLVEEGEARALVTAGSTGAMILAAAQRLKLLPGIRRSALASVYPTEARHGPRGDPFALILDVGATVSASADDLIGFAVMGAAYSQVISEIRAPRVALLSNGAEAAKGTPEIVEAHHRLRESPLNFVGNVEGLDIPKGTADVIACDGFLGTVVLKMLEGISEVIVDLAKEAASRSLQWRIALSMLGGGLRELRKLSDFNEYGGAPLLGFQDIVIKAHGRSGARAIRNGIKVAAKAVRGDLVGRIREGVAATNRAGEGT